MTNILLQPWDTPFDIPAFDKISDDDFLPAFEIALERDLSETRAIAQQEAPATFANTIDAMMSVGQDLTRVLPAFYAMSGAHSNEKREAIMREMSPALAAHSSAIYAMRPLFDRINTLYQNRATLGLTAEQARVLELTHQSWVRAGAGLTGAAADRMKEIKQRLASLGTQFSQNMLADERDWYMQLQPDDLDGLPQFLIRAAQAAGTERGVDAPIITTSRSLLMPFLQFSPNRELRRQAQQAWANRGARGGDTDNRAIAAESINLRHEMAQLLGYENFAAYKLETEMAKNSDNVRQLLMDVWKPAKTQALADQDILAQMMRADGVDGPLQPWDWRYYSEKRRQAEHDLDEELVKPYFQLDRMIDAAFDCANRLFGLEFAPMDVPLYHSDCRVWAVTRGGEHIAIFIGDYFARGSKRSGAWCSAIQAQAKFPDVKSPIVVNVCNFAKDTPALLSADDVRTLFHEFGHALHQMLSNVTYEMVSGTSVPRDFVELPSQLYEHWAMVPEVMQKHALHCETGDPIPQDLLDRVIGAQNYDMGFSTVEFIASAMVDLEYHQGPLTGDVMERQAEILRDMGMPTAIEMRHATPHFAHVFSGGYYASAYYSYMWAEVMDADAFEAFAELQNPFDPATAASLERNILSTGGSRDPEELYTAFRGRLPQVDALLKGRGLAG